MSDYHGIDTYVKMDNLPYDGIHHIDMHMKLLDESTLLVSEYPAGVADGPQIRSEPAIRAEQFHHQMGNPIQRYPYPQPSGIRRWIPNQRRGLPDVQQRHIRQQHHPVAHLLPAIRHHGNSHLGRSHAWVQCGGHRLRFAGRGPHSFEWRHPLHHPLRRCGRSADDRPAVERHGRRRQ